MLRTKGPGQIEISFRFARHVGPRFVHGAVTLQFDSLQPYGFISEAMWPMSECYADAIKDEVEKVLNEIQGHLDSTQVILKEIEWDDVASCESGFRHAARAATKASFEVGVQHTYPL